MSTFGVFLSLGTCVCLTSLFIRSGKSKITFGASIRFTLITMLGGYLCARVGFQLQEILFCRMSFFTFAEEGHMFYGLFIGALLSSFLAARMLKVDRMTMLNFCVPAWALTQIIGRLGCFVSGCCHGAPCSGPWAICNPPGFSDGISRHPVQLYEAAATLLIVIVLAIYQGSDYSKRKTTSLYCCLYAAMRLGLDFLRDDNRVHVFYELSVSQLISLIVFTFSLVLLLQPTRPGEIRN